MIEVFQNGLVMRNAHSLALRVLWLLLGSCVTLIMSLGCASQVDPPRRAPPSPRPPEARASRISKERLSPPSKRNTSSSRLHFSPTERVARSQSIASSPPLNTSPSSTFQLGILLPLSGPFAQWGRRIKTVIETLVKSQPVFELRWIDTEGRGEVALDRLSEFHTLVPFDALIGPMSPWVAFTLSSRIRWLEIPWFPMTSLPTALKHPFVFSWRIAPSDEAQAIAEAVCRSGAHKVAIVSSAKASMQEISRLVLRDLRRCGAQISHLLTLNTDQRGLVSDGVIDQALITLSGRRPPYRADPWWGSLNRGRGHPASHSAPAVDYEALILIARNSLLSRLITQLPLWDIEIDQGAGISSSLIDRYQGTLPMRPRIYLPLGGRQVAEGIVSPELLNHAAILDRPPPNREGDQVLRALKDQSTLALELSDLFQWLAWAQLQRRSADSAIKALRVKGAFQGVWGRRQIEHDGLSSIPMRWMTRHPQRGVIKDPAL